MIYQYIGISIMCSVLLLNVWEQAEKTSWKTILKHFVDIIKQKLWKRRFVLVLYIVFVLQRTVFNRAPWGNPLSNVIGEWWIIKDGKANYEMFENIILFLPLNPLLEISGVNSQLSRIKLKAFAIPFLCSMNIEIFQLFTRVGTFQLSDLCYNTVGGVLGSMIFGIALKCKRILCTKRKSR